MSISLKHEKTTQLLSINQSSLKKQQAPQIKSNHYLKAALSKALLLKSIT